MTNRSKLNTNIPARESRELFAQWPMHRHHMAEYRHVSVARTLGVVPYIWSGNSLVEDEQRIANHVTATGSCPFDMLSDDQLTRIINTFEVSDNKHGRTSNPRGNACVGTTIQTCDQSTDT